MSWSPISLTVPQYVDANGTPYSGAVLKAYTAGTSTPISVATDSTGGTTVGSVALNASGYPAVSGNVIIPHVQETYKLALYATQAAADANTGALWSVDNISSLGLSTGTAVHASTSKATPVDTDELALVDSAANWVLKKLTWANLKATLQTTLAFLQSGTGAVATTVQAKLRESLSVKDFGAVGDGVTDDSVAIAKAILWATTPVLTIRTKTLEWPNGSYLVTQNNFIGANLGTASYGGMLDSCFSGVGRNSSLILFKPTVANAYCYDQSASPANPLIGFSLEKMGIVFDNSANGSQPIHFIKSIAGVAGGGASQNYRLRETRFDGVTGSILFTLSGIVNEDVISGYDTRITGYKSVIVSTNLESLLHNFYALDLINITGDVFDYTAGGSVAVYGLNYIASGTAGVNTGLLRLRGGTTGQTYYFSNLRSELIGANTRILIMDVSSENTVTFESSNLASNIPNNQAWAIVPVQHHASISFKDCILPARTGGAYAGSFLLVDNTSGIDYSITGAVRTKTTFENCDQPGDRSIDTQQGWVDWSGLTGPNANYTTCIVAYKGCGNIPDSIEYGHLYRYGRTFVPNSPAKLIFRGNHFPSGDGVSAAVVSVDDFNVIVPRYNFLTEIVVMRAAMGGAATNYQIEFIDTLERTTPGTGVIFGATTAKANNLSISERVPILRQFSGTIAQRTIWARMVAGYTLGTSTGTPTEGGIYAEVL